MPAQSALYTPNGENEYLAAFVLSGEADAFIEDGIRLKDGRTVQGDLTIYATGFKRSYEMLGKELQKVQPCEEGYPLYRNILPPDVKVQPQRTNLDPMVTLLIIDPCINPKPYIIHECEANTTEPVPRCRKS